MGTRASFFIGDPQDVENRIWLVCVAYDGYPEKPGLGKFFEGVTTVEGFREAVEAIADDREDYTNPETHSFPFPWKDNLFLTDYTYAFMNGAVYVTSFWREFVKLPHLLCASDEQREAWFTNAYVLPQDVPAPESSKPPGPDSILMLYSK